MPERDANQLAADATTARRGIISALIAVKGHLDQPYPDDDRWTPWTRFVEPALQRLDESVKELAALVGTLQQERDDLQDACRRERDARHKMELRRIAESERAEAAEAALAEARQALAVIADAYQGNLDSRQFHELLQGRARRALAELEKQK